MRRDYAGEALSIGQDLVKRHLAQLVQPDMLTHASNNTPDTMASPDGITSAAFQTALNKMIAASGGKLKIKSGTRSTARQTQLWNAALKKYGSAEKARKWVAPPGHSNHERGLAADLAYSDALSKQWAHEHAGEFGLNFPLSNEDWHIELRGTRG